MQSYIFKLKFKSLVRFGQGKSFGGLAASNFSCCADTLFSALCYEILCCFGEEKMLEFVQKAKKGDLLFSDMFPWKHNELYLPKPALYLKRTETGIKDKTKKEEIKKEENIDRKFLKKVQYIPFTMFNKYLDFIKTGSIISNDLIYGLNEQFAYELIIERAAVGRDDETMPYPVSGWRFAEDCGLYFIVKTKNDNDIDLLSTIIDSLSISGIGGKKSTGMGKFELAEKPISLSSKNESDSYSHAYSADINYFQEFSKMLDSESGCYMSLSVLILNDSEFELFEPEDSYYSLLPRSGFIYSKEYSDKPLKKKPIIMFASGSCFKKSFPGDIIDLSDKGAHPVFRYGKGMYMGVNL